MFSQGIYVQSDSFLAYFFFFSFTFSSLKSAPVAVDGQDDDLLCIVEEQQHKSVLGCG